MVHCSAWGCHHQSKRDKHVSYHRIPRDVKLANIWKTNINRIDFPKDIWLCDEHFEEKWFDASFDMKQRLMNVERISRRLIQGAVPTLFPQKTQENTRLSSVKRIEKREQSEVIIIEIHLCFIQVNLYFIPLPCLL